ncbi:hypothetical protein FRC18_004470 [Serendipita sp. 400]|nr:hypothetical protein FRC18_004470 [Serendipita sp. 400]
MISSIKVEDQVEEEPTDGGIRKAEPALERPDNDQQSFVSHSDENTFWTRLAESTRPAYFQGEGVFMTTLGTDASVDVPQWNPGFWGSTALATPGSIVSVGQPNLPGTSITPSGGMLQVHTVNEPSHQPPLPDVPAHLTAQQKTLPEILGKLVDYFSQAEWVQNHEKEPPLLDNDPLIKLGLVQSGGSRFDALISWDDEKNHCRVPGCQLSRDRTQHYTTERRSRALAHVYGHFGYKPIPCVGECGKVDCDMRFLDKPSKAEHIRSYTMPPVKCAVCRSTIARKNYKRHLKDVDRLSEDQIAALLGSDEEAAGMSA